jgi:hypothetical protein
MSLAEGGENLLKIRIAIGLWLDIALLLPFVVSSTNGLNTCSLVTMDS